MPPARTSNRQAARNAATGNHEGAAPGGNVASPARATAVRRRRVAASTTAAGPRPTAAGMRALQEQLEVQQREAAELREQLRETLANINGNAPGNSGELGGRQEEIGQAGNAGQQQQEAEGNDQERHLTSPQRQYGHEGVGTGESQDVAALRMDMNYRFSSILAAIKETQKQQRSTTTSVPNEYEYNE